MLGTSLAVEIRTSDRWLSTRVIFVCCLLVYVSFVSVLKPTLPYLLHIFFFFFPRLLSAVMSSTPSRLQQSHCRRKHYPSSTYLTHV